jgi:ADP-ribose pyrophosphatase
MRPWKTIAKQPLCQPNKFLTVELHTVELPNGRRISDWPWIILPDYVNILTQTETGMFLVFKQTKYAVGAETLSIPGGYLEPGEVPLAGAQRELLEETGYVARHWMPLGKFVVDSNRGAGWGHFFLATEARSERPPTGGDLEEQELRLLSRADLEQALDTGQFRAMPWTTIIDLGLRKLGKENEPC